MRDAAGMLEAKGEKREKNQFIELCCGERGTGSARRLVVIN